MIDTALLRVFPEETWEQICDGVHEPETLLNLIEAASLFRRILHPRKIEYLFPQVLEILVEQNCFYLQSIALLRCRLVCKCWKAGVDNLLTQGPDPDNPEFDKYSNNLFYNFVCNQYINIYSPRTYNRVVSELQQAEMHPPEFCQRNLLLYSPSNMFPGRHLFISENYLELFMGWQFYTENGLKSVTEHRQVANRFLKIVGHHFWHARVDIKPDAEEESWDNVVCNLVSLLPNLKSLEIHGGASKDLCSNYSLQFNRPFPILSALQVLTLEGQPKCVVAAILLAHPQIKVLTLSNVKTMDLSGFNLPALHSLHTLSIFFIEVTEDFHLPVVPGLRTLRLGFSEKAAFLNWSIVFAQLELCGGSLTELYLCLPFAFFSFQQKTLLSSSRRKLYLPNVKRLELSLNQICSLDFLLGFRSLEFLKMRLDCQELPEQVKGTIINFKHLDPHFSQKCNIWKLISSLRTVKLTTRFDSRWVLATRTYTRPHSRRVTTCKCQLL